MNYRHAYHAGNFADGMKHALLVWLVRAMQRKPTPIFALDSHAGRGAYDLAEAAAARTQEWRAGIGRLLKEPPEEISDYVRLVCDFDRAAEARPSPRHPSSPPVAGGRGKEKLRPADRLPGCNEFPLPRLRGRDLGAGARAVPGSGAIATYPGSPALIRALLRPADRLACCELHPEDAAALRRRFARDPQVSVHHRDGWEALGALLPPAEKRGLVLIDPPYEAADEFERLAAGLRCGCGRFRNGVFAAWHPIKHRAPVRVLHAAMRASGIRDVVAAELLLRQPVDPGRLNGSGLLVINPPFGFEAAAGPILVALLARLGGREPGERWAITRLADE